MNDKNKSNNLDKDQLRRYLKGELSEEEAYRLENSAMQSSFLKDGLEGLAANNVSPEEMDADLSDIKNAWYQRDRKPARTAKQFQLWPKIAAAAAIFLLFFVGHHYWDAQQGSSNLFATHFDELPQENGIRIRGEGAVSTSENPGLSLYKKKKYKESLAVFSSVIEENPMETTALLYAGLSTLQLGQETAAENYFSQLTAIASPNKNEGHWYLALLYVKQERYEEAKAQLEILTEQPDLDYIKKATDLLAELPVS